MALWLHRPREPGRSRCFAVLLCLVMASPLLAQLPGPGLEPRTLSSAQPSIEERLRQLEERQSQLVEENGRLSARISDLVDPPEESAAPVRPTRGEEPTDKLLETTVLSEGPWRDAATPAAANSGIFGYTAGYDNGFVITPNDPDEFPFELRFNSHTQVRYTAFDRAVKNWTDSAGVVSPVTDRSNFELPRGRAIFSGFAFLPQLTYDLNIDYNTVSSSQINFRAYWLAYRFNRGLTLYLGQNAVPGSREWLVSTMYTLGADRSLATTFFRPSLSQGIWAMGEPVDGLYYHAMIANGFNTIGSSPQQLNSRMAFSLSLWAEPWGDFGPGYSDFDRHDEPAVRFGTSLTYSPEQGQQGSPDVPENADIRLTDGTLLTETGALAPGVALNVYYIGLAAFDVAFKYRGFSVSGELYLRDLFGLVANGPLPRTSIFDYGGFVQAGYYVIPQKCELYARTSQITGRFGSGSEYAGGFNWFFLPGKQNLRYTLDAAWINHSPADQNRTDYRAGDTGFLLRSQIQFFF